MNAGRREPPHRTTERPGRPSSPPTPAFLRAPTNYSDRLLAPASLIHAGPPVIAGGLCVLIRSAALHATSMRPFPSGLLTGQEKDKETATASDPTGEMHYRARAYSPRQMRFVQMDPSGGNGDEQQYAYATNGPVQHVDPQGRQAQSDDISDEGITFKRVTEEVAKDKARKPLTAEHTETMKTIIKSASDLSIDTLAIMNKLVDDAGKGEKKYAEERGIFARYFGATDVDTLMRVQSHFATLYRWFKDSDKVLERLGEGNVANSRAETTGVDYDRAAEKPTVVVKSWWHIDLHPAYWNLADKDEFRNYSVSGG